MQPSETTTTTGPQRWSRLAALGLFMAGLGPLIMLAAALIWQLDVGDFLPFLIVPAVVAMLGGFLVVRFSDALWSKIVGIVAALVPALALYWTASGLASPGSFFDFVPGLLLIPGAIIAITGCVAGIVARRRGKAAHAPADGERKAIRTVVAVVGALALLSAVFTFVGMSSADESEADTTISLKDFEFDQDSYEFEGGTTILVRNDDPFMHTFSVEELDIDEMLTPGTELLVEIPDEPGDYTLYCEPHTTDPEAPSGDDMAADLTIQ